MELAELGSKFTSTELKSAHSEKIKSVSTRFIPIKEALMRFSRLRAKNHLRTHETDHIEFDVKLINFVLIACSIYSPNSSDT